MLEAGSVDAASLGRARKLSVAPIAPGLSRACAPAGAPPESPVAGASLPTGAPLRVCLDLMKTLQTYEKSELG